MKNNLKTILMLQNKTQRDVSEATGITECAISRYISGERNPNGANMIKIANYLDLDVQDVWGVGDDN